MKFHCDRCKTRYSIADERVRGKILKIRCKNCSAVITVREDMGAKPGVQKVAKSGGLRSQSAVAGAGRSLAQSDGSTQRTLAGTGAAANKKAERTLKGAGAAADRAVARANPSPFSSKTGEESGASLASAVQQVAAQVEPKPPPIPGTAAPPPDMLDEEWYVSVDGTQVGPFTLQEAKNWIAEQGPEAELHCWNEDFDDWLPIEKVGHFRGLRADRGARVAPAAADSIGPFGSADDATEENDRAPSHAESARDIFAEAGGFSDPQRPFDSAAVSRGDGPASFNRPGEPPTLGEDDGLNLDIGEASRVVKLPMLMHGLVADKVERSSTGEGAANPEVAASDALPGVARIGQGSGAIARAASEAPVLAPLSDMAMANASPDILTATTGPKKKSWLVIAVLAALIPGLIIFFIIARDSGGDDDDTSRTRTSYQGLGSGGGSNDPNKGFGIHTQDGPDAGTNRRRRSRWPRHNGKIANKNKPDAGASGDPDARPLGPADVTRAARAGRRASARCHMRSQRKDFKQIKRIKFYIKVGPSGAVITVTPREHTNTYLAKCVRAAIRKWRFRKSPKGISTETSIVFSQ